MPTCWAPNVWGWRRTRCVVVEDAPAGILSGLAAGCQVIAVNAPADAPKLEQVDLRLDSLAQIAVDKTAQGAIVRRLA